MTPRNDAESQRKDDGRDALDPRRRILSATVELIGEAGWARVTTRKVAERAGVNNALLHYYFGSKQALLVQAASEVIFGMLASPIDLLLGGPTLHDGAAEVLRWLADLGSDGADARVLAEISVQAVRDPALRETVSETLRDARARYAEQAAAAGLAPERAEGLAILVFAMLDGALLHRLIDPALPLSLAAAALEPLFAQATP